MTYKGVGAMFEGEYAGAMTPIAVSGNLIVFFHSIHKQKSGRLPYSKILVHLSFTNSLL
jgi:hypothetical protein